MNPRCAVAEFRTFKMRVEEDAELAAKGKYGEIAAKIKSIRFLPDDEGEEILSRIRVEQDEKAHVAIDAEKVRLGQAFVEENVDDFDMIQLDIGDGKVGIGTMKRCGKYYCGACFMTPDDVAKIQWSNDKAVGLVGFRIMESMISPCGNDFVFDLPYSAKPSQVLSLAGHTLITKGFLDDSVVPAFFRRSVQRGEPLMVRAKIAFQR